MRTRVARFLTRSWLLLLFVGAFFLSALVGTRALELGSTPEPTATVTAVALEASPTAESPSTASPTEAATATATAQPTAAAPADTPTPLPTPTPEASPTATTAPTDTAAATPTAAPAADTPPPMSTATAAAATTRATATPTAAAAAYNPNQGGGGGTNQVRAVNRRDGQLEVQGNIQLNRIPGPTAQPVNLAYASSSCVDCTTIAVALQINLISTDARWITPQNAAVALNERCSRCRTFAVALQYTYQVDDPQATPREVADLMREMDREVQAIAAARGITIQEAAARLDAVIGRFVTLAASLDDRRSVDERDTGPATPMTVGSPTGTAAPTPTGTPPASPTTPLPTRTAPPQPTPTAAPQASPRAATPQPSSSPVSPATATRGSP